MASGSRLIGDLVVGSQSSFWFNTVVRADCNYIRIGSRTNIQDGSVIHVTNKTAPTHIGSDVTVGHSVVIHGCTIGDLCLIGMGAIVMDKVEIPGQCIIGAGSVLSPGKVFREKTLILGSPAREIRPLKEEELAFLKQSSNNYLEYMKGYMS